MAKKNELTVIQDTKSTTTVQIDLKVTKSDIIDMILDGVEEDLEGKIEVAAQACEASRIVRGELESKLQTDLRKAAEKKWKMAKHNPLPGSKATIVVDTVHVDKGEDQCFYYSCPTAVDFKLRMEGSGGYHGMKNISARRDKKAKEGDILNGFIRIKLTAPKITDPRIKKLLKLYKEHHCLDNTYNGLSQTLHKVRNSTKRVKSRVVRAILTNQNMGIDASNLPKLIDKLRSEAGLVLLEMK